MIQNQQLQLHNKMIECRGKQLSYENRTLIMGILNVTPDSFSDGGKYNSIDLALRHAVEMIEQGADIIDIGGESTRPGFTMVPAEIELERTIPIIERLAREIDVPISIDTYKSVVAEEALKAGAHIVNDIWGLQADSNMAEVVKHYDAPVIIMHNRQDEQYVHFREDIINDLRIQIELAKNAGITDDKIILDPGIGFAKSYRQNLLAMKHLDDVVALGYPVLLGTSKKSIVAKTLELPLEERMEGTAATVAYGISKGCAIVRVHDVLQMKRVAKMMDAMVYCEEEGE